MRTRTMQAEEEIKTSPMGTTMEEDTVEEGPFEIHPLTPEMEESLYEEEVAEVHGHGASKDCCDCQGLW